MSEKQAKSPTILVILDGFGVTSTNTGNPIVHAQMPHWGEWQHKYPMTVLAASGEAVGLLPGTIGNSEVGHLTIGAGRAVTSTLARMQHSIDNGSFFKNKMLLDHFAALSKSGGRLHIMGLLSDAGVHSHEDHAAAILKMAHEIGVSKIYVHPFLDGRDIPPKSAQTHLARLQKWCDQFGGTIASMQGRFYAMDRDHNWERTEQCYHTLTSHHHASRQNWHDALSSAYARGETDEFISPILLDREGIIRSGDGIFFFNFRPERAVQLSAAFLEPEFGHFTQTVAPKDLAFFISPVRYKASFNNDVLFTHTPIENTLLDVLSQHEKTVFIIAETEKYAHVTYYFRGEVEKTLPNETCAHIPSIKAKSYAECPQMSAAEITQAIIASLQCNPQDFYVVNYANADMVAHSANFDATVKACECLDEQLGALYNEIVVRRNGTLFITADHGNAEQLEVLATHEPTSTHTTNPVPFMMVSTRAHKFTLNKGSLVNVAPTILQHLNLPQPPQMTAHSLLSEAEQ